MTREGATKTIMAMVAAYPNYHPADMSQTVRFWFSQLEDYTDEEVAIALKAYILADVKGFAPSIGQVVALIPRNQSDGTSELAAWDLVVKAIRNGNYGAEEEFSRLPDAIRSAVGSAGQIREWASMPIESLSTVAQSNFLKSYRAVVTRERMMRKLPPTLQEIYRRAGISARKDEDRKIEWRGLPRQQTVLSEDEYKTQGIKDDIP